MFYQLMPLHWGLVDRTLIIEGVEPDGKILPPVAGGDTVQDLISSGKIASVAGSGLTGGIVGSGNIKQVKGSGKLCP